MDKFSALLEEKTGLYFPKERWGELEKKLRPLTQAIDDTDHSAAIRSLTHSLIDNKGIAELAYHLTIGETYFFRDARMFAALEHHVLPEIIARHAGDRTIRIWSAGCCTGEEPYSIAILLKSLLPRYREWDIHILGSDINSEFLKKAQQGRYGKWSFRTTPHDTLEQHFLRVKNGVYQINDALREMVEFRVFNLVDDAAFEMKGGVRQMDLILCNNVLIYFSRNQVSKTIRVLTNALIPDGWLTVTAIEAPFVDHQGLSPHSFNTSIFFKKEPRQHPHILPEPPPIARSAALKAADIKEKEGILLKVVLPAFLKSANPVLEYRFSEPSDSDPIPVPEAVLPALVKAPPEPRVLFEDLVKLSHGKEYEKLLTHLEAMLNAVRYDAQHPSAWRQEAHLLVRTLANSGRLAQALEWCEGFLQTDKLDPILHYLHAEILVALGMAPEAIKAVKRALFLDSDFIAGHYLLCIQEEHLQHHQAAKRECTTTLDLLASYGPDQILPGTEELTVSRIRDHLSSLSRRI